MGIGRSREKAVRRLARGTAALLAVGAGLSALPIVGVPWSWAAVLGYAELGYVPANCARPTSEAQALNGDVIHVCQTDRWATYGFFTGRAGHQPLTGADATLTIGLPDPKLSFSCCSSGANQTGTYLGFTPVLFDPVALGPPLAGTVHYAASHNGTTYATVAQTSTLSAGASAYQLRYAITNTSGAPLKLRPFVEVRYYGPFSNSPIDAPIWSTSNPPRQIVMRHPRIGGSVTVTSSTDGGSPAISAYSAGSGQLLGGLSAPAGSFDNVLHGPDGFEAQSSSALGVEWTDHFITPLPAGVTAYYTLNVALQQPRDLQIRLHAPSSPPIGGVPTSFDAAATDDRSLTGKLLRWRAGGDSGSVALDATGKATFTIPGFTGAKTLMSYVDVDGDGVQDPDEESHVGRVYAPGTIAPPPPPPVASTAPPPGAPPIAQVAPGPTKPTIVLTRVKSQALATVARSGLRVSAKVSGPVTVRFKLTLSKAVAKKLKLGKGTSRFTLATAAVKMTTAGTAKATLKLSRAAHRRLRRQTVRATLDATAVDALGRKATATTNVSIRARPRS